MKLKDVFEKSVQFFKDKKIETARLDAELLISHALKTERLQIYLKYEQPLSDAEVQACREVVKRRGQGEPVAYILGEKGFYGEVYSVGPGCLIPRPETETLVEEALRFIVENKIESPKVLDLGAGSGCIGFSILKNCPTANLVSIEKSEITFSYLKTNQEKLNLKERSQIILADVMAYDFSNLKFDLVVANPPYIDIEDPKTESNVRKFEPSMALFSEQQGHQALFDWSTKLKTHLNKPGLIMFEMGYQQGARLKKHFEAFQQFSNTQIVKDLSGLDRFVKSTQY